MAKRPRFEDLTLARQQAVAVALDPRTTSIAEVARVLGITTAAAWQRLRSNDAARVLADQTMDRRDKSQSLLRSCSRIVQRCLRDLEDGEDRYIQHPETGELVRLATVPTEATLAAMERAVKTIETLSGLLPQRDEGAEALADYHAAVGRAFLLGCKHGRLKSGRRIISTAYRICKKSRPAAYPTLRRPTAMDGLPRNYSLFADSVR